MELVKPEFGLIFWQTVSFLVVVFVLARVAWKPILESLKEREESIHKALSSAEDAKAQMAKLQDQSSKLLEEAHIEKDRIVKEAFKDADKFRTEEKEKLVAELNLMRQDALKEIENSKRSALSEIQNQISLFSLEIAEKLLRKQLENPEAQKQLIQGYIQDLKIN